MLFSQDVLKFPVSRADSFHRPAPRLTNHMAADGPSGSLAGTHCHFQTRKQFDIARRTVHAGFLDARESICRAGLAPDRWKLVTRFRFVFCAFFQERFRGFCTAFCWHSRAMSNLGNVSATRVNGKETKITIGRCISIGLSKQVSSVARSALADRRRRRPRERSDGLRERRSFGRSNE